MSVQSSHFYFDENSAGSAFMQSTIREIIPPCSFSVCVCMCNIYIYIYIYIFL